MSISLSLSTAQAVKERIIAKQSRDEIDMYLANVIMNKQAMPINVAKNHAHTLVEALLVNMYDRKHAH